LTDAKVIEAPNANWVVLMARSLWENTEVFQLAEDGSFATRAC